MQTYFKASKHWKFYDIFHRSKISALKSSLPAILELAAQYKQIVTQLEETHKLSGAKTEEENAKAEESLFIDMCEICLWGNKTDLSLLPSLTSDEVQKLQGSKVRKAAEKNILVNDLSKAFQALYKEKKSGKSMRRLDIILDNSGFELFVDLLLAGYLIAARLVTYVIVHPKDIPWFVSDVTPRDFNYLFRALKDPQTFFGTSSDGFQAQNLSKEELNNIDFLYNHWYTIHSEGQLIIRPNKFWTEGGSFWRLPATAPDLYEELKESELVIFKGDLNYRKLAADVCFSSFSGR
jgi:damage-control phosphatase, subfamily III